MYRNLILAIAGLFVVAMPGKADDYPPFERHIYIDREELFKNQERFWKEERHIQERQADIERDYREALRRAEERYRKELDELAERRRKNYQKYGAYIDIGRGRSAPFYGPRRW